MNTPVPAPRTLDNKRPVPTPRRLVPIKQENAYEVPDEGNKTQGADPAKEPKNADSPDGEIHKSDKSKRDARTDKTDTNTFSRRVRSLSNTSKQIAEDLGGIVQEGKKVVIESTRQSVRKITKRFASTYIETNDQECEKESIASSDLDIFNTIRFNSPINTLNSHIYNNVNPLNNSQESLNSPSPSYPPPNYPPPPLRLESVTQESVYDEPQSVVSGSTSSSGSANVLRRNPYDYEAVFPAYPYNSDTDSCVDMTAGTIERNNQLQRCESWTFYDPVPKSENIYNNIDNTPALEALKVTPPSTVSNDDESIDLNSNASVDGSIPYQIKENSLYENHNITLRFQEDNANRFQKENAKRFQGEHTNRPTKSIILQFDPLSNRVPTPDSQQKDDETNGNVPRDHQAQDNSQKNQIRSSEISSVSSQAPLGSQVHGDGRTQKANEGKGEHLRELEQLLQGDLYNNSSQLGVYDNWSVSNESEPEEYMNPPTPPTRYDSLPEDIPQTPKLNDKSKSSWFTGEPPLNNGEASKEVASSSKSPPEPKKMNWLNVVLKKAPEIVRGVKNKENFLQRPALVPKRIVSQKGMLYKVTNRPVEDFFGEFSARWCVLSGSNLVCYADNTCDSTKEHFQMQNILSVQMLQDHKFKYRYENEELHCFEINTSGKSRGGYVFGSRSILETKVWLQRIGECLTNRFSSQILSDFSRLGWAYVREGVSGQWTGAWIVLVKRMLHYAVDNTSVKTMDLRKARCIILQNSEAHSSPKTTDKGPNMLVDCVTGALYLRMWTARETKVWCHIVKLAAHNNGPKLDEQQLTKNNVPVLVEKCINFIYIHGSMTEGIYRRAGSGSSVNDILTQFRKDSWAVQLTIDKYSEHDVATALKRFFRDLPEPLFTNNKRQYLYQVSKVNNTEERIRMYKAVFDQFPDITQNTIKKLLGHLHFINSQSSKNLMNIDNLASVWGPTLMHYEDNDDPQQDSVVVSQLISLYRHLFPENAKEAEQERVMFNVLERYNKSNQGAVNTKTSGDFRVWVYLNNKQGETFNVAIGPKKTAYEICAELSPKIKLPVHELTLEELVLNDNLMRPIHYTEKVLDVVLRWGYWDEPDRKDNCLILTNISKYREFIHDKSIPVSAELRFADNKTKHFKTSSFEFAQAKLSHYKDKACSQKIDSWNIEDIVWYMGNEPKRQPLSKWTITFFPKKETPKRSKATPWFGNILAWPDPSLRSLWLATMLRAEHPKNLTPPPQHVNLLSN